MTSVSGKIASGVAVRGDGGVAGERESCWCTKVSLMAGAAEGT